jgi:type II secretory pathway pseudopilin PulG
MRFSKDTAPRHKESGYSLLMVVFMVATVLILASAVAPNLLTQGRREREAETVWRGEQYARAVGLYYRKFGRFPTRVEDLTKQTNGVRFLRQAYTDPMNKEDGSWRFIYVGPNGQLIGSLRHSSLPQNVFSTPSLPASSPAAGAGGQSNPGMGAGTGPGMATNPVGAPGGAPGDAPGLSGQQTNSGMAPNPLQSQPQPMGGAVIGGNIIGVGSKIKKSSLRVYEGGDTYEQWEFIWNPAQQVAIPGQQATVGPGAPSQPQGQQTPQPPQTPPITPPQ